MRAVMDVLWALANDDHNRTCTRTSCRPPCGRQPTRSTSAPSQANEPRCCQESGYARPRAAYLGAAKAARTRLNTSAPGGIRTPNLLIRRSRSGVRTHPLGPPPRSELPLRLCLRPPMYSTGWPIWLPDWLPPFRPSGRGTLRGSLGECGAINHGGRGYRSLAGGWNRCRNCPRRYG